MSKRAMVSTVTSWYGRTKPSFLNNNGIKVNRENFWRQQRKELFSAIEKVVKHDDQIFAQDVAPSHRFNVVQDFIKIKLKRRFIRA